jgi:hypothetical protein
MEMAAQRVDIYLPVMLLMHSTPSCTRARWARSTMLVPYDEIANFDLCGKLLREMEIPHETKEQFDKWVKYTHDRPFNDHRYAVDGTKLRQLGWDQKTSFAEGLKITVDWYRRFGEKWWGDISHVLAPFPIVSGLNVIADKEPVTDVPTLAPESKKRKVGDINGISSAMEA